MPPDSTHVLPASEYDSKPQTSRSRTAPTRTIPIRILLLSDTHNIPLGTATSKRAYRDPLPDADLLIHAGDFSDLSYYKEHLVTYNAVASHPAPVKLVVPGNHDLALDKDYFVTRMQKPQGWIGDRVAKSHQARLEQWRECTELWTGPKARNHGILTCIDEGVREVKVKGTTLRIYTTPYTPYFRTWAFSYHRSGAQGNRFNDPVHNASSLIPDDVDIIVSHGPPHGILDQALGKKSPVNAGCQSLLAAVRRIRPRLTVFGHIHEAYGVERVVWSEGGYVDEGSVWRAGSTDLLEPIEEKSELRWKHKFLPRSQVNRIRVTRDAVQREGDDDMNLVIDGPELKAGEESLFVNGAIMNYSNLPRNSPWVIDLDVPLRDDEALQAKL